MSDDVLNLLKRDHQATVLLLGRFEQVPPDERDDYFCEVVHTLVGHEVAEEMVVYPPVHDEGQRGQVIADARLHEQAKAEKLLAEMESDDPASQEFAQKFWTLRDEVMKHAQSEESTAFPLLEMSTSSQQRGDLGERYLKAKEHAPTHPHPHAPNTPPGNTLLGPIAALFDRARDSMHR